MTEIFALLTTLPDVPKPLNKLPGCYERELPNGWRMAVNAHDKPMRATCFRIKPLVPPFEAMFVHDKTMAMALVSPFGGTTVFDCEDDIIRALKAAGATLRVSEVETER